MTTATCEAGCETLKSGIGYSSGHANADAQVEREPSYNAVSKKSPYRAEIRGSKEYVDKALELLVRNMAGGKL